MCGRKFITEELTWDKYREMLNIIPPSPRANLQPNYNIAPTHLVPVCITKNGARKLARLRWGLVPFWAKEANTGYTMFNAKAEELEGKRSYSPLLESHRCVAMVSGFYEWTGERGAKQAYKVENADGSPMLMPGLWTYNERLDLASYTIVTTAPSDFFKPYHHRQAALLLDGEVEAWMEGDWAEARQLVAAPWEGALSITRISDDVGKVKNNYAGLLEPV